ncbi:MAG TPA: phytanoyl-CoA dioxygenase family protein [Dongiaceae bacterium]
MNDSALASLEAEGFALIPEAIGADRLDELRQETEKLLGDGGRHGARNIFARSATLRDLASHGPLRDAAVSVLGPGTVAVRGIIFDKLMEANWMVGWHQDLTIAVAARHEAPGFGAWTVKEGVPHVQPPAGILEGMVTLRLHLDDCDKDNGALMVLPASHRQGRLCEADVDKLARERTPVICAATAGDLLLLRLLTAHASRRSTSDRRRRVLHLEFASGALPPPLRWHEAIS